jgi:CRISPR-associated protein Cas1
LLRRNASPTPQTALDEIDRAGVRLSKAADIDEVMGHEGQGAAAYFGEFSRLLRPAGGAPGEFEWTSRNRRPPRDPVNAMLSFAYAMLVGVCKVAVWIAGLDPMLGFLHADRPGGPALALDFMEEYRPILADSVVLSVINTGELRSTHFVQRSNTSNLTEDDRKKFIAAWEYRLDRLLLHPIFGYRVSHQKLPEIKARLLARHPLGELPEYPEFRTR